VKGVTAPHIGTLQAATMATTNSSFTANLEVMSLYDNADIVIGTDLEQQIGISIDGLPVLVALPEPLPLPPEDVHDSVDGEDSISREQSQY
jgi:hypothetical protein